MPTYLLDSFLSGGSVSEILNQLTESLGSQYRLERELGGGGMSRVFLAGERKQP